MISHNNNNIPPGEDHEGLRIALTLACIGLFAAPAHAQAYPTRPVTIVVTLAAGGAADVIARAVAQRLTEEWGQPVVVENKGGANNQVGTTAVRSRPMATRCC